MKDATRKIICQSEKTTPQLPSQPQSRGRRFRYTPLNPNKSMIRLVDVLPERSADGLIQCSMFNDQFQNEDKRQGHAYCCLSYTWGNQSNKRQIRINGKLHTVAQNLWEFLHALRRHRVSAGNRSDLRYSSDDWPMALPRSYIWIDALCINQKDEAEKSQQVQRMGQIYKRAQMVLMWLGRDPRVESAVRTLYNSEESLSPSSEHHGTFMNLSYWSRAWITQEIVLANQPVIFFKSGFYEFLDLSLKMDIAASPKDEWTAAAGLVGYRLERNGPQYPQTKCETVLHVLNSLGTSRKCKNNRDQIYSVLALSNNKDDITVAYDVTTAALAKQVLTACEASVCLCSTSILFKALKLSGNSTSYVEMDVPRQSCWSESPNKCKDCNDDLSYLSKDKLEATLCLRTMCPTFQGHIYALSEKHNLNHRLVASRSSRLYFKVSRLLTETFATDVVGVSVDANATGMQDGRQKWRILVRSFIKIARLEERSRSRPVKMCPRSMNAKRCDYCACGQQVDDDATCFSWNETGVQSLSTAPLIVHRTLSCTPESLSRYRMQYFNREDV